MFSAELLAIKEAIFLVKDSGWTHSCRIILETDCSCCVDWFHNPNSAPALFKGIIADCLRWCTGLSWSIQAVPRESNSTADKLAKSGISRTTPWVWRNSCDW
ncbi:hypothetical protein GQ457_06G023790 [Hibiscus cannabinus]